MRRISLSVVEWYETIRISPCGTGRLSANAASSPGTRNMFATIETPCLIQAFFGSSVRTPSTVSV
jgi:hypothetical protein